MKKQKKKKKKTNKPNKKKQKEKKKKKKKKKEKKKKTKKQPSVLLTIAVEREAFRIPLNICRIKIHRCGDPFNFRGGGGGRREDQITSSPPSIFGIKREMILSKPGIVRKKTNSRMIPLSGRRAGREKPRATVGNGEHPWE